MRQYSVFSHLNASLYLIQRMRTLYRAEMPLESILDFDLDKL